MSGARVREQGTTGQPRNASLLDAPAGLVMIGLDGPAMVCADGVCATPEDDASDA